MAHPSATYWHVRIAKRDLVDAVGIARARPTLRRKGSGFEADVLMVGTSEGISIRSSHSAMDIAAKGEWASPVAINGAALRRLAPKLNGPDIELVYEAGRLLLNGTSIPAREA